MYLEVEARQREIMTLLAERSEKGEAVLKRLLTQRNDNSRFITIWIYFILVWIILLGLTVIGWKFWRSMHPELQPITNSLPIKCKLLRFENYLIVVMLGMLTLHSRLL
jgi:hypothetical protein